jgi:hypothetical protein
MEDGIEGENPPELSPRMEDAPEEDKVPEMIPVLDHAHAPHGHGSGIPWLDIIVGLSAIFISVVSLVVSIEHGKTMEKMVDQNQKLVVASTLPLLTIDWNMIDPVTEKPMARLNLHNDGVGPAIIESFEIRYKGVAYTPDTGLLRACCAQEMVNGGHPFNYANISGEILPARESAFPILIKQLNQDDKLLSAFFAARKDLTIHACYCSVLEECWETDFDLHKRPRPVKECKAVPDEQLW